MNFGKGHHLHLIDGSAFIFRAYHALPPLTRNSDGLPVGAVSGFCNMLQRYVESNTGPDAPTHVAVIFDKGSHTFRNDLYDQYKANRDEMPEDLPRVMSVGRLDLNSEGLLLLTNDGAIKRQLELPATGWLRRYRVRINGRPSEDSFAPLRAGLRIGGERFQPMSVTLDRQQGANAWLTIGLREGKNREIRRAIEAIGLQVNRLIRVSFGPFQLGTLKLGEVEEVRRKIMRDQLGLAPVSDEKPKAKKPQRRHR